MRWLIGLMAACAVFFNSPARAETLTVFAAASLKTAFDAIGEVFTAQYGTEVVFSFAGTSVLARQIEQGAPADIFVSANDLWTAYLAERDLLDTDTTTVFASNALVVVAPTSNAAATSLDPSILDEWETLLGEDGRIATALVDAVPAGIYAREALQSYGLWEALSPRLAQTDNVRSALVLVARGEAPLGLVYASDATADNRTVVVAEISESSHSAIQYTASGIAQKSLPDAEQFLEFLLRPQTQALLADHGFLPAS